MLDFGILGMNARNLQYIKRFNPRKQIRIADDKIKTKRFLDERGIPNAKMYGVIKSHEELFKFDFSSLPKKDFIVKPNKGSRGRGVLVVHFLDEEEKRKLGKFYGNYYSVSGEILSDKEFRRHLLDILYGKYSLTVGNDEILIEEKLIPGGGFKRYCKYGLADVRIIAFNLIPIASMVRVPTQWSGGTSNLDHGGVGLGVEVGTGKIKSMQFKGQIFTKNFPGEYADYAGKKIPFWNDILLFSSKLQYFVNLGFIGLDWVITEDGPKLLEMNARAGLKVQNVSTLPLKSRLDKIADIKIDDPEKGVEIAKSLFTTSKTNLITFSKVLYISQKAQLIFEDQDKESDERTDIVVEVDLNQDKNYISASLYNKVKNYQGDVVLDLYESEIRFKNLVFEKSEKAKKDTVILGANIVSDYYIKPIKKVYDFVNIVNPDRIKDSETEQIYTIDQKIDKISKKLNLQKILKPINYLEQMDNFITWHGVYNPKFKYSWPNNDKLVSMENELLEMKEKYFSKDFGLKSKFAKLFNEKIDELLLRTYLLKAYKEQNYDNILKYNEALFSPMEDEKSQESKQKMFIEESFDINELGELLTFSQLKRFIKKYLNTKDINGVKIIIDTTNLARISVVKGDNIQIRISNTADFREKELLGILAHEIDVHLLRYINGAKTGWDLLKSGTGFYLKDEEGLAIYKSFQHLPGGYEKKGMYERYYFLEQGMKNNFSRLAEMIRGIKGVDYIESYKYASRVKKGITNTSIEHSGAIHMRDKVYLDGYMHISDWIEKGGDVAKLGIGKVKTSDLDLIL